MRMTPLGVLFLGLSMWWVGCSVETTGDDDDGGEAGEGGSAGWGGKAGSSGRSGSSGTGGSGGWSGNEGKAGYSGDGSGAVGNGNGGSYAGNGGSGATSQGGDAGDEATGGTPTAGTWGDSGQGGEPPGVGGEGGVPPKSEGGAAGEGDVRPIAECDPDESEAGAGGQPGSVGTPYPNCEPVDSDDECELCIQESCCEESKGCWALNPANVCGWGGPSENSSEIGCYTDCIAEWVGDNAACGSAAHQACVTQCQTEECGEIGDATWALAVCMNDNCADECFGATCTY